MASDLQKQVLVGGLVGALLSVLTYIVLGGKRDELEATEAQVKVLEQEVDKGRQLKANAKRLEQEIAVQTKQLEELIKIMPTDLDRGDLQIKIKKLADAAGLSQVHFKILKPVSKDYYFEHPYTFKYRGGFHEVGQFASLLSGFDKILNITAMTMQRSTASTLYPLELTATISAFVYDPTPPKPAPGTGPKPAAPKPGKED